ncbi:unnamed protein product [Ostreobium quekettii]|uniref:Uncharacterized protein n=1 Tax=Ostreobium quekettii TaxID=121088 RepID=A0A8S1J1I4_9CHLO|nr:unnamed protein product [Ostreobium quekettii]|eukprot:evm.model.scf_1519.2 EVM.evm.TU.scf_1519.2   scf_1519:6027-9094(-)
MSAYDKRFNFECEVVQEAIGEAILLRPHGWQGGGRAGTGNPDTAAAPLFEGQSRLSKKGAAFEGAVLLSEATSRTPEGDPAMHPSNSENLTSCMADLMLTPCTIGPPNDTACRGHAAETKLELIPLEGHGCGLSVACAPRCALPPGADTQDQAAGRGGQTAAFLDLELGGTSMFYEDGAVQTDGLFGEEELREPDFDGALPSLLSADAVADQWPGSLRDQRDLACSAPARPSSLLFSKSLESAYGGGERACAAADPWGGVEWVPAEIVSAPLGMAAFFSAPDMATSGGELFQIDGLDVREEDGDAPPPGAEQGALAWMPKSMPEAPGFVPSECASAGRQEGMRLLGECGQIEDGGDGGGPGMAERVKEEPAHGRQGPVAPEGATNGRGCRRRVHPVSKFIGEEVCWTPDDNDCSDGNVGRERVRRGKGAGRSGARPYRSRARAFGRRSSWEGGNACGVDAVNKRRKQHNPWSLEETRTLVKGVEICGGGKWADIKRLGFREIGGRSPVDLKDKWRNLLRVALLPLEQIKLKKADNRHNLPMELLHRVKELAQNADKSPRTAQMLSGRR